MLGYRAISRGVYLTRQQAKTFPLFRQHDRGKPLAQQQEIQRKATIREQQVQETLKTFEEAKGLYDAVLLARVFRDISFVGVELDKAPDILGNNVFLPPCDFNGRQIQTLTIGSPIHVLTVSLIALPNNRGAAVFVWHNQHDAACRVFVDSLRRLPTDAIPHAIARLVFSFCCENSFLSPVWWDQLDIPTKMALEKRFLTGIRTQNAGSLADDGMRVVHWKVTEIHRSDGFWARLLTFCLATRKVWARWWLTLA